MAFYTHSQMLWLDAEARIPDCHAAFRGGFSLAGEANIEIHALGASWYRLWLDGAYLADGPERFDPSHPEYSVIRAQLSAGEHVLAAHVIDEGVQTKRMPEMPPFLSCQVFVNGDDIPLCWKSRRLEGFRNQTRRINGDCGWIDWCDTRRNPAGWEQVGFDDSDWALPVPAGAALAAPNPPTIGAIRPRTHVLRPMAQGQAAESFGYEHNDPPVRFFLRDLDCAALPPQGIWRRYDLGRVRLGCPRFALNLPPGAVVEIAYCEALRSGRVAPWITLSNGASCSLDHFIARGGPQEFFPLTPKGGRFLEVHVLAPPEQISFINEDYLERAYYGDPSGSFACDDGLLNQIWAMGVETFRACAEDAITDNPTRERGQWTGDVVVALETASAAYPDLRLIRRMLRQAAWSARADGMIVSLSPAQELVVSTYAAQWVSACVRFHELTGDTEILEELFPAAERCFAAFEAFRGDGGLSDEVGWAFVDWGYARPDSLSNPALTLHYLAALRAMQEWCRRLGHEGEIYGERESQITQTLQAWLRPRLAGPSPDWDAIGYHVAALALTAGLFAPGHTTGAVAFLKRHLANCFPNDPDAPRLSDPAVSDRRLITPYFAHFAFPPLIAQGEMEFVQEQYRRCWGWMLDMGVTTCLEVFDTRWSHCHQWSACPTWQLSRFMLGLHPRFDRGRNHFDFGLYPGTVQCASGNLPLDEDKQVFVEWTRNIYGMNYSLETPEPIWIRFSPGAEPRQVITTCKIQLDATGKVTE